MSCVVILMAWIHIVKHELLCCQVHGRERMLEVYVRWCMVCKKWGNVEPRLPRWRVLSNINVFRWGCTTWAYASAHNIWSDIVNLTSPHYVTHNTFVGFGCHLHCIISIILHKISKHCVQLAGALFCSFLLQVISRYRPWLHEPGVT